MKAVIDTSILVSAFLTHTDSPPRQIYRAILDERFTLVSSVATLEELEEVLNREKMKQLHQLTAAEIGDIVDSLATLSECVPGVLTVQVVNDDPDDDIFVATAIEGAADYIVSGDRHLLAIKEHRGIQIVSARQFTDILSEIEAE